MNIYLNCGLYCSKGVIQSVQVNIYLNCGLYCSKGVIQSVQVNIYLNCGLYCGKGLVQSVQINISNVTAITSVVERIKGPIQGAALYSS